MVSLVIVSHSARLAQGVKELVEQVAQGRARVFAAGGLDADTLGTSVETILQALAEADNPRGTLVLVDLGSAVLSAEAALELLAPEVRARARLCAAPLVEGAVAAGVQASLGSDLDSVCRAALEALQPKLEQIGGAEAGQEPQSAPGQQWVFTLANPHGLHARPAARLAQALAAFDAQVSITNLSNGKGPVPARSITRVAALSADRGHQIRVEASGPQAAEALAAVQSLVEGNFGE